MKITNNSPWIDEIPYESKYPKLTEKIETDIAIVGSGITGSMTAYYLSKAGKKVVVVDKGEVGLGETSFSTAMLTPLLDQDFRTLIKSFGKDNIQKVWDELNKTVDEIGRISKEENIDCDFRIVNTYLYSDSENLDYLELEASALKELGVEIEVRQDDKLGFGNFGYLAIPHQGTFRQRAFVKGLLKVIEKNGGQLFENSLVTDYCCKNPTKVTTEEGEVSAQYTVIATHQPNNGEFEVITRTTPMQTYVIEAWVDECKIPQEIFFNTDDPYKYFKVDKIDGRFRIILGGEDHLTGKQVKSEEEIYNILDSYLALLLGTKAFEIKNRWSGQYFYSADGLPYVGSALLNEYQLFATGYGGDGLLLGSLSAKLMGEKILGTGDKELLSIFSPRRLKGMSKFVEKGFTVTKGLLSRFTLKGEGELENLKLDDGMVVNLKGKPTAVYKDKDGNITKLSAVCTHQGCIVQWNPGMKSWDCPCHGSTFKKKGEVMTGPAKQPLKKLD